MQIAAVQFDIRWEDRQANHEHVRRLLDGVELRKGALVVLPEMFDTGFSMNTAATDPGAVSASEAFCRDLAAARNVAVLAGVVARATDGRLANEAIAFSPDGKELARYRKMQPFTVCGEHQHYPAGVRATSFEWEGVRVAPFICYDLRFPELFRPAARAGAELIVVIASWPFIETRSEHWVRLLQARAIENQAYVLGVNRTGTDPQFTYAGGSSLFDPVGHEIFHADSQEQVICAEVEADAVRSWRDEFPALRDVRKGETT
jgi:predicted amidohydrolase